MDPRVLIALLLVVGFGFTATNSVLAYRSAKRRLTRYGQRLRQRGEKEGGEDGEHGSAADRSGGQRAGDDAVHQVLRALQSSRTSLLLAGLGLLLTTIASVWALFA